MVNDTQNEEKEIEKIINSFMPLIVKLAKQYKNQDVDMDELIQVGRISIWKLVPKCRDAKWLPLFIKKGLISSMHEAAKKQWDIESKELSIDTALCGEIIFVNGEDARRKMELEVMLDNLLNREEAEFCRRLIDGFTQKELAAVYGVSQQCISARLRAIKRKLLPYKEDVTG